MRWTLALLALVPFTALASISAFVTSQANDDAEAATRRITSIEETVSLGQVRSAVLLEAMLYDLWGINGDEDASRSQAATDEQFLSRVRAATDRSLAVAANSTLDPTMDKALIKLARDLNILRASWDSENRTIGAQAVALVQRAANFENESTANELISGGGSTISIILFEDFRTTLSLETALSSRILIEGVRSGQQAEEHIAASARSDAELGLLVGSIDGASGERLSRLVENSSFLDMRALVNAMPIDGEPTPINPAISSLLLAQGFNDSAALYKLAVTQVDDAQSVAYAQLADARRTRSLGLATSFAGIFMTLLATRLVGGRLTRRIERVANVAAVITSGELDVPNIEVSGSDEVSALAVSVNEMSTTLALLQRQLGALAEENIEDPVLATELPGTIGLNLRTAISRVNTTTSMLRNRADTDGLTGLFNRSALEERARTHLDPPVVALIDLDGFKQVNDTLGHAAGDEVLISVAQLLESQTRKHDLVGRLGGDEFAIVAWEKPEIVMRMAERVVNAIAAATGTAGVGCSIGVAAGEQGEPFQSVLKRADTAMYTAKRQGKGAVVAAA